MGVVAFGLWTADIEAGGQRLEDLSQSQFGPFLIDVQERVLWRKGRPVPLTPKAFDVLAALVEQPGRLISKEELLQKVWPDTFVEESNLAYQRVRTSQGAWRHGGQQKVHRNDRQKGVPVHCHGDPRAPGNGGSPLSEVQRRH